MRRAWDRLGTVRPTVAAATGLPADCGVLAGIHDSNASYLPHLLARAAPFTVLSTGTWIIAMAAGVPFDRLDATSDMLANVDARGDPVPTARFMGGREVELVAGVEALRTPATAGDVAAIIEAGVMALPSFVAGSGPFMGRPGRFVGEPGPEPARRTALAALYAALTVDVMLDKLGAAGPGAGRGQLPPQRRVLRPARGPAPGPADLRHRRSQRHGARCLALGPLGRRAGITRTVDAIMGNRGTGPISQPLAGIERRLTQSC